MARLRKTQAHYSSEPESLRRQVQELERVIQDFSREQDREQRATDERVDELENPGGSGGGLVNNALIPVGVGHFSISGVNAGPGQWDLLVDDQSVPGGYQLVAPDEIQVADGGVFIVWVSLLMRTNPGMNPRVVEFEVDVGGVTKTQLNANRWSGNAANAVPLSGSGFFRINDAVTETIKFTNPSTDTHVAVAGIELQNITIARVGLVS